MKKNRKRFLARINIDDKDQVLGTFDTSKEAAEEYDRAAIDAGRPTSKLNFPGEVPKGYVPKKKKLKSNNTIGYRGVVKIGDRFKAQIHVRGKRYYLGHFDTSKEAAEAFDLAAIQANRPRSDLNFPEINMTPVTPVKDKSPKTTMPKTARSHNISHHIKGFNGVSKRGNLFLAHITINGKRNYVGTFMTARDAAMSFTT